MDGVLVVDKPEGPTSHDVVATVRRVFRERRVGHTGTLDPMATGVLPLVIGKATRLARFLGGCRKRYEATVVLGVSTDTYDAQGQATSGARRESADAFVASEAAIREALGRFVGPILQVPPAFSAKKVAGIAAHRLARRGAPVPELAAVPVTVHALGVTAGEGERVHLDVEVSPGFYVRSLAHDLGQVLGCGAHLAALRRTASGEFTLADSVRFAQVADAASGHGFVPLGALLARSPAVCVTSEGARKVRHGQALGCDDVTADDRADEARPSSPVRLLGPDGELLGVAEPDARAQLWPLHPSVVLT
jgi:tRNA pseudouridine55 synthase